MGLMRIRSAMNARRWRRVAAAWGPPGGGVTGVAQVEEKPRRSHGPRLLPHADHTVVDKAKICDDLLSSVNPVGRFKARVFLSLGYSTEVWKRLRDDLLQHGRTGVVERIESSAFGMRVVISDRLEGPNGTSKQFRTS
jgi:hypothetical protein